MLQWHECVHIGNHLGTMLEASLCYNGLIQYCLPENLWSFLVIKWRYDKARDPTNLKD